MGRHDFNAVRIAFVIAFFPIAVAIGLSMPEPECRDNLRAVERIFAGWADRTAG